jgi:5-formyltetrahydrofolate cyclo-ligase
MPHSAPAKRTLRHDLLEQRARLDAAAVAADGSALAQRVLELLPDGATALTVGAYVSTAGEPDTSVLLDRLVAAGHRVLLPVLRADLDLDWAALDADEPLVGGRFGLRQPAGPRLGPQAVAAARLVVCPGLAGAPDGARLGRGGGSYDRALPRTSARRVLLLHDDEVLEAVPVEAHDERVDVLVTATRTVVCR